MGRNDRALVVGRTGSGKTFLARYLIEDARKPYSVVYDAKNSESIEKWATTGKQKIFESFDRLQQAEERRLIYRPNLFEAADRIAQERFFEWVYERQHTRLLVDEAYAVLGGTNPSFYFQACLSRGRERGISTIIAAQRPHRIPLLTLTEAEHLYIFSLRGGSDKARMCELTDDELSLDDFADLGEHEFFYFNVLKGLYPRKLKINDLSGSE